MTRSTNKFAIHESIRSIEITSNLAASLCSNAHIG